MSVSPVTIPPESLLPARHEPAISVHGRVIETPAPAPEGAPPGVDSSLFSFSDFPETALFSRFNKL